MAEIRQLGIVDESLWESMHTVEKAGSIRPNQTIQRTRRSLERASRGCVNRRSNIYSERQAQTNDRCCSLSGSSSLSRSISQHHNKTKNYTMATKSEARKANLFESMALGGTSAVFAVNFTVSFGLRSFETMVQ